MSVLTRDDFKNAPAPKREAVQVPALGGEVFVRQISIGERDEFEAKVNKLSRAERRGKGRARIVALIACDADGNPLFDDDDVEWLAEKPTSTLEPIINAHVRLNEYSGRDLEELEKN